MTTFYSVQILKDGTVLDCYEITIKDKAITIKNEPFVDSIPLEIQGTVEAKDKSEAIKKVNKKRLDLIIKHKWSNQISTLIFAFIYPNDYLC